MQRETYLGDGLYMSFEHGKIKLRAPRENGDHEVYLEPHMLNTINQLVKDLKG